MLKTVKSYCKCISFCKEKEVICSLKNILKKANGSFIAFLVCLFKTKGCNLTLKTTLNSVSLL